MKDDAEPRGQPLDQMPIGQEVEVAYIALPEPARLVHLANLGLRPGARVRLQQKTPAAVVRVGGTTLAIEPEIAGAIYVKRGA